MAWTTDDLTTIERAIASGQLRVQYQDRMVHYQTISDMLKARDAIKGELAQEAAGGGTSVKRYSYVGHDRGN